MEDILRIVFVLSIPLSCIIPIKITRKQVKPLTNRVHELTLELEKLRVNSKSKDL